MIDFDPRVHHQFDYSSKHFIWMQKENEAHIALDLILHDNYVNLKFCWGFIDGRHHQNQLLPIYQGFLLLTWINLNPKSQRG